MAEESKDTHPPTHLSSRERLWLATGMILVLFPCLAMLGTLTYLRARRAGTFSHWRSLGAVPGHGVEIVTGDNDVVYVRTAAEGIYSCAHRTPAVAGECWQKAQEPLSIDSDARFDQGLFEGDPRPPPGTLADSLRVMVRFGEDALETRYVLLGDGTVWTWDFGTDGYWTLFVIVLGLAGSLSLVIGLIIGWAVLMRLLARRSGKGPRASSPL